MDDAHALSPAAGGCLEQHRIAELLRHDLRLVGVAEGLGRSGHDRNTCGNRQRARGGLAAHGRDGLGRRTDEDQARIAHGAREPLALREKPIARVDRVGTGVLGRRDDPVAAQVAFRRRRAADVDCLIRGPDVRRCGVGVAVDGNGGDTQLATGANDAHRDLAAIGDQDLAKHRHGGQSGMLPCFFGGFRSRFP
jgi:hypothetical protein